MTETFRRGGLYSSVLSLTRQSCMITAQSGRFLFPYIRFAAFHFKFGNIFFFFSFFFFMGSLESLFVLTPGWDGISGEFNWVWVKAWFFIFYFKQTSLLFVVL